MRIGFSLSSEENGPAALVRLAQAAEDAGFEFAYVSDHFHPWTDRQGESPFVWSVLGGIAQVTRRITVGTGVTCPLFRTPPPIVAQAAATVASMMPGRFVLGLGTGENLNEHILAQHWPSVKRRQEMLVEAAGVIRRLWTGESVTHYGPHFTVEEARIYTLPEQPIPIQFAASTPAAAELAGRHADGMICTSPDAELVRRFRQSGGAGKPCVGHLTVCWGRDREEAVRTAHECWPVAGIRGPLKTELSTPSQFEAAAATVSPEDIGRHIPCGPDVSVHTDALQEFAHAGFDHLYIHQIGPDQMGFIQFYRAELMTRLGAAVA